MKVPFYHIDAFTRETFGGNPAAVVPLPRWLEERALLAVAAEQNLPATAFFVPHDDDFEIRWFAPTAELDLCGHGTLATSYVLLHRLHAGRSQIDFAARSGILRAERDGERIALEFPAMRPEREREHDAVAAAIGIRPVSVWEAAGARGMAVLDDPTQVRDLRPNVAAIAELPFSALIVTAHGFDGDCDFVSRYFVPKYGIAEDYATGSAHCVLTPYWAGVLAKPRLFARQLSARGAELWLEDCGDRVRIAGECVPFSEGTLTLPAS
ncbi:MAG TPA: PhzF family phenazine biosynthesis protein [Candidatus Cybelea sp.]|nr:PhzF family phenazine biosynthesis protein [Candidatus Cybelea sp.]